jgi:cold-inducible RNA-binding protein
VYTFGLLEVSVRVRGELFELRRWARFGGVKRRNAPMGRRKKYSSIFAVAFRNIWYTVSRVGQLRSSWLLGALSFSHCLPFRAEIPASFLLIRKVNVDLAHFLGKHMGNKLYVGNLSYDVTNESLQSLFAPFGNVTSAQVIMDRDTGRSKGFGFVEMSSSEEAQAAITGLHGKENGGRALKVNEAQPKTDRPRSGGGGGYGGGGGGGRRY